MKQLYWFSDYGTDLIRTRGLGLLIEERNPEHYDFSYIIQTKKEKSSESINSYRHASKDFFLNDKKFECFYDEERSSIIVEFNEETYVLDSNSNDFGIVGSLLYKIENKIKNKMV